jgi:hypothetical protein
MKGISSQAIASTSYHKVVAQRFKNACRGLRRMSSATYRKDWQQQLVFDPRVFYYPRPHCRCGKMRQSLRKPLQAPDQLSVYYTSRFLGKWRSLDHWCTSEAEYRAMCSTENMSFEARHLREPRTTVFSWYSMWRLDIRCAQGMTGWAASSCNHLGFMQ